MKKARKEEPSSEWSAFKRNVKAAPPWFLAVMLVLGAGAVLARIVFRQSPSRLDRGLQVSLRAAAEQGGDSEGSDRDEGAKAADDAQPPEPDEDAPVAEERPLEPSTWLDKVDEPAPIGPSARPVDPASIDAGSKKGGDGGSGGGTGEKGSGDGSGSAWGDRTATGRAHGARTFGGSEASEDAVEKGLEWLRRHQSESGAWRAESFTRHCTGGSCGGEALKGVGYDAGCTALCVMAFLGGGYTHTEGRFRRTVHSALSWLRAVQGADGRFGAESMYTQAVAVIALAEALGLTGDRSLERPLKSGVAFLAAAQQQRGGFTYDPRPRRERNDTSITVFAAMAFKSARAAGVEVPGRVFDGIAAHIARMTREDGTVMYADGPPGTGRLGLGMVSASLFANLILGADPKSSGLRRQIALLKSTPPAWGDEKSLDQSFMAWYYANLSFFALGGSEWASWNPGFRDMLVARQRRDGCADGSWDPRDVWGNTGGRIYATAIHVLDLEIYYKYTPGFLMPSGDWAARASQAPVADESGSSESPPPVKTDPAQAARERMRRLRELIGKK